ncbi:ferric-uptake regulator [Salinisphaera sp. PC39]|uniref:Fur family transcriptional regulator n=1 Tax=Salinisphaera sp. PC39 TaxID=1304156 RepID=UPI00333EA247
MSTDALPIAFTSHAHDHKDCVREALARAEEHCHRHGLRFTRIRRRVLELIWQSHTPTKAYDLLDRIREERGGAAPPTVYRALDFLLDAGLVHRIESLNAFVGCDAAHGDRYPKFLICRHCHAVAEIAGPAVDRAIANEARKVGFTIDRETIEIRGLCQRCAAG